MAQALERFPLDFPGYTVFAATCPEGFLAFSDQSRATCLEYNLAAGTIYRRGAGGEIPTGNPGEGAGWMTIIEFVALSLEDCFNATRRGKSPLQDIDSYVTESYSGVARSGWRGLCRFSPDFFTPKELDPKGWDIDASAFDLPDQ